MTRGTWCWITLVVLWLTPASALAQAISGTVTDASGAVVPGVTVEAASPALIEQTRTVVTNEAGRYTIVSLRPGVYAVRFTLAGFNTVTREGVQLTSDFTAQINAQLTVGTVGETIKVEGATPVVDVQTVATPKVMTRDMMDALPTSGRTAADLLATLPGVTNAPFGQNFRNTSDSLTTVDGMRATFMIGAGPSLTTASDANNTYEEISFTTGIDNAESGQPGMRINLVPRSGSNEFRGTVFTTYSRGSWQASNIDDELFALGLRDPAKTLKVWDINPTVGGPILRDKLWFQSTFRGNGNETQVLGSYADADSNPYTYTPSTQQAVTAPKGYNFVQRLTWQLSAKDRISGQYDWSDSKTPYFYNPLLFQTPPPEASLALKVPNAQQFGGRWTRTHTSKLLLEASMLHARRQLFNDYRGSEEPWSARYVESLPTARPTQMSLLNRNSNQIFGLANITDGNISRSTELRLAATYVTGSHSAKAGISFFQGSYHRPQAVAGHVILRQLNGLPSEVLLQLPGNERDEIDADWGVFVQDRWTLNRLTVSGGVRLDLLKSSTPDQVLPGSIWLPEQRFSKTDVLDWKDVSPRVGVAYDLFGNGKTALKAAFARYVAGETVALTGAANPIRLITAQDTRTWTDLNGDNNVLNPDGTPQLAEIGPARNATFGQSFASTLYDPDVLGGWFKRGYLWETNVSVQHELLSRVAITALFYRRTIGNQRTNDNLRIDPSSYDGPFCVTSPSDPRLPGGGGQEICGLYDIKPQFFGATLNNNTFATNLGTGAGFKDITTGYEISMNARLSRAAFVTAGLNLQSIHVNGQRGGGFGTPVYNTCDVIDNPEVRFCDNVTPYRPDVRVTASYLLPLEVQVAGIYRGLSGPQIYATWNADNSVVAPRLGRPLSGGNNATKTIQLMEPNQEFAPMRHIFDLRVSKQLRFDRYRALVGVDLFNAFNGNGVSELITTFSSTGGNRWQVPSTVTSPRQIRFSLQFDF